MLNEYLPSTINSGPWITAYTLNRLRELPETTEFILPVCSLATPFRECAMAGDWLLPPLYDEALNADLLQRIVHRIQECFPRYAPEGDAAGRSVVDGKCVRVVEFPRTPLPARSGTSPTVVAFSVDTAIEEHGPHLPLATDTIQSYSVLRELQKQIAGLEIFRPVDYGQLTWGLPFGFSIDLTAELLTEYVAGFSSAVMNWLKPQALYIVDVHGSITHRQAIVEGLRKSGVRNWMFRWLHEPLAEFASGRGDQHAGGVETALVQLTSARLVDDAWFPARIDDIAVGQMSFQKAVELTPDLAGFSHYVHQHGMNGVIGDIRNYNAVDARLMFACMLQTATEDVGRLLAGDLPETQNAGRKLW